MATRIFSPAINTLEPGPTLCVEPYSVPVGGEGVGCFPEPQYIRRVVVSIRPVLAPGGAPLSHLDANGHALHCAWLFRDERQLWRNSIVRVPMFSVGQETDNPVIIESNAGSYRIPRGVQLMFTGGAEGDPWDVDIIEYLDHNFGHPDLFALDTFNVVEGAPVFRPDFHESIRVISGSITVDGLAVVLPTTPNPVSLAAPTITAGANSLYRTEVYI